MPYLHRDTWWLAPPPSKPLLCEKSWKLLLVLYFAGGLLVRCLCLYQQSVFSVFVYLLLSVIIVQLYCRASVCRVLFDLVLIFP